MCWLLSNVLIPYAIYFDSRIVGVVGIIIQAGVMVSVIYFLSRWVRAIAVQQSASFIQLNRLTAEEHAVLSYLLPLVMYIIAYSIHLRRIHTVQQERAAARRRYHNLN